MVLRFRFLVAVALLGLSLPFLGAVLQGGAPAAADEQPAPPTAEPIAPIAPVAPAPTPSSPPANPGPIASPRITAPAPGTLQSGPFVITGTAEPGARVQVSANSRSDPLCATTADSGGAFDCDAGTLPSGPDVVLRVVQLVDGYENRSASLSVDILNAPTAGPGSASEVSTGYGTVRGTGLAGATVTASAVGAAGTYSCTVTADGAGAWACNLGGSIPSGTLQVRATQSTGWSGGASNPSGAFSLQIDSDTPASPLVTAPTAGGSAATSGAIFSGTGESGALVTVFAGSFAACTVQVSNGAWGCTAGELAAGVFAVSAIQQDPAGNVSGESAAFPVTFQAGPSDPSPTAPAGATPAPGAGDSTGAGAGSGGGGGSGTTGPGGAPGGAGSDGTTGSGGTGDSSGSSSTGSGGLDGQGGSGSGSGTGTLPVPGDGTPGAPTDPEAGTTPLAPPAADGTWAGSTRFSAALQPAFGTAAGPNWLVALAIALGALVLVAAPARLLTGALTAAAHTRAHRRGTLVTGRNRSRDEFDRAPQVSVNPWVLASVALVASAAIGMLSGPVESQPAYLRLLAAICIAFAALNLVSVGVPKILGRRMLGLGSQISFAPRYLVFAGALTLLSRVLALEPALLFGLVVAIGCAEGAAVRARAQFALLQLGALVVLGTAAWGAANLLPAATTPGFAFATEVLNTLVLGSFGAAAVLALPFGRLGGRAVFAWSRPAWLGVALGCFTLLAAVLVPSVAPMAAAGGPAPTAVVLLAVSFAAVSLSVWTWVRFIAPALK